MAELALDQTKTDNGRGVQLANGDEPVAASEDTEPLRTLAQRMAAIRAECAGVDKEQIKMGSFNMQAHTVEGVLAGVRHLFEKHGVWMLPCLDRYEHVGNRCDVVYRFDFQSLDNPNDQMKIMWPGSGTDNADKALAKAGTNALKEMLKKVFLITDRDDASEEEDKVEFRTNEGASREEVEQAKSEAEGAIQKWATSFKAALENAKDPKEIARLQRDNKDQLGSDKLPAVTRSFFIELIEKRKKETKDDTVQSDLSNQG